MLFRPTLLWGNRVGTRRCRGTLLREPDVWRSHAFVTVHNKPADCYNRTASDGRGEASKPGRTMITRESKRMSRATTS
jgi:hypothetical protein